MFNQDSTLMTILNKAADMVILSVLWCICSLPVVTIGAASSALYHATMKVIRLGRGYAFSTFFTSFRQNLKQTIPAVLLLLIFYAAFGTGIYLLWPQTESMFANVYIVFSLLCIFFLLTAQLHLFPLIGRFRLSRRELVTVLTRLAFGHLGKNIMLVCLLAFAVEAGIYYPPLLFIVPAAFSLLCSFLQEPMFHKHINYED
ncbi:MAG TPA: YesL family protein [Candidatus Eisenbergiella intestinipullorum]|nr:YesL family protein [Candidatus Eisenbergiella intestinipullorum]